MPSIEWIAQLQVNRRSMIADAQSEQELEDLELGYQLTGILPTNDVKADLERRRLELKKGARK